MIPCKEHKCLKFPVCKTKESITCTPLRSYFQNLESKIPLSGRKYSHAAWDEIHKYLPNAIALKSEDNRYEKPGNDWMSKIVGGI